MTEHYKSGDLTEPFYFNRPAQTPDGAGGYTTTQVRSPVDVTKYHFCKVRPLRGGERQVGDVLGNTSDVLFVVYKGLGVLPTDTLVYDGREYSITRTAPAGRSAFQEIEATAGVAL